MATVDNMFRTSGAGEVVAGIWIAQQRANQQPPILETSVPAEVLKNPKIDEPDNAILSLLGQIVPKMSSLMKSLNLGQQNTPLNF